MARTKLGNIIEDFSKLTDEKKLEYAEMFSEGNEDLKRLLIKMWGDGIQTYASCAGHDRSEAKEIAGGYMMNTDPYIFFDIKKLNEKQQKLLFKSLIVASKKTDLVQIFEFVPDTHMGFERHGLTIRMKNEKNSYAILNDIYASVMKTSILDNLKNYYENNKNYYQIINDIDKILDMFNKESEQSINKDNKNNNLTKDFDVLINYCIPFLKEEDRKKKKACQNCRKP